MEKEYNDIVAIIDSGIGGISILKQLIKRYKSGHYIYFADNLYMPYGNKDKEFVKNRVEEIIDYLKVEYKVGKIIIACNTASSCLKSTKDKSIKLLTFNKNKKYLTTELTQHNLKGFYVISSKTLASDIEANILKPKKLNKIVKECVNKNDLDKLPALTLGCTHYELVADIFKKYCKNTLVELNSAKLIEKINISNNEEPKLTIIMSNKTNDYEKKLLKLISF